MKNYANLKIKFTLTNFIETIYLFCVVKIICFLKNTGVDLNKVI